MQDPFGNDETWYQLAIFLELKFLVFGELPLPLISLRNETSLYLRLRKPYLIATSPRCVEACSKYRTIRNISFSSFSSLSLWLICRTGGEILKILTNVKKNKTIMLITIDKGICFLFYLLILRKCSCASVLLGKKSVMLDFTIRKVFLLC